MGQHSTAHEDGNLLDYLDASVASLPRFFAPTHCFEERKEGGDAES